MYGLHSENSDVDFRHVCTLPVSEKLDLRKRRNVLTKQDNNGDDVYYELEKFVRLF